MKRKERDYPVQLTFINNTAETKTGEIVFLDFRNVVQEVVKKACDETKIPEYIVADLSEESLIRLQESGDIEYWQDKY